MYDKLTQITKLFAENEQAEEALKNVQTKEEAIAVLAQYGIDVTVEEFVAIGKEVTSDELSEEMLMLVAGGGSWFKSALRGIRDFFQGFLDAF